MGKRIPEKTKSFLLFLCLVAVIIVFVVLLIIGILSSNRVLGISITGLVFATIILILFLVKADEQF